MAGMTDSVVASGKRRTWLMVAAAGVVVAGGVAALTWPRTTTVKTMTATVDYADGGEHLAIVQHVEAPVGVDHFEVVLGRDPSGTYGHRVRLEATGLDPESVSIRWAKDNAILTYASGHQLTVPARAFTGGR
jgi:hypothetical protein